MQAFFRLTKVGFDGVCQGTIACAEVDADGEILDYFASKPYFQQWSDTQRINSQGKSLGNVRLQHDPKKVAGVLTDLDFDDKNQCISCTAQIIDPTAKQMLQAGALTGFSIGGEYAKKTHLPNGLVSYIAAPIEVSVVDRPCSPSATFSLVHSDGRSELRKFAKTWGKEEINSRILRLLKSGATESLVSLVCGCTAGDIYQAKRESRSLNKAVMVDRRRRMVEFNHF